MDFSSRAVFDPDGRSHESERLPDLVFQEAFVREMQLYILVGKENECRRGDGSLGHVIHPDFLSVRDSGALEVDRLQKAIHL